MNKQKKLKSMRGSKALFLESCGLAKFKVSSILHSSIISDGFLFVCPFSNVDSEFPKIFNKLKNTLQCS